MSGKDKHHLESTPITVLFSGGIDSTACIHFFKSKGYIVKGLFFDYSQPAALAEKKAVEILSPILEIETLSIKVLPNYSLASGEILGRNSFLITGAIFLAGIHKGVIALGMHAGTPYYDCSVGFFNETKNLVEQQTDGKLTLISPFLKWDKNQIYEYFKKHKLPFANTYSCETGTTPACGKCLSCKDRSLY